MANKPRSAVLISGNGSNLQAIAQAVADGKLDLDLSLVVSNRPQAYGLQRAQHAGIATECIIAQADDRDSYDRKLMQCLQTHNIELVVLAGFMRILSDSFVQHYMGKLVNIHPSLLPKYKGLNTHQRVLDAGDKRHGASVHYVLPELDAGPVILQASLEVNAHESAQQLAQRIHALEHKIYPLALQWIVTGDVSLNDGKLVKNPQLPDLLQF